MKKLGKKELEIVVGEVSREICKVKKEKLIEKFESSEEGKKVKEYDWFGDMYFKFVVDKDTDIYEIDRAVETYRDAGIHCDVYLMPVGGTDQLYFNNYKSVAEMALKRGWRYSPRLQVDIWRNAWGT